MKKIFTLISVALMAMSVNAQDAEIFIPAMKTYTALEEATTANCKVQFGDDTYGDAAAKSHNAYIKSVGLSTPDVEEGKDRYVLVSGKNNPNDNIPYEKPDGTTATGSSYSPDKKNVPAKGCYYMITPSKPGKMLVGIVLNANKSFYVVKKSTSEALATSAVTLTADGEEGTQVEYNDTYQVTDKLTGTAGFDVEANETYYVFCNGSKLGFFGYVFTPGTDTAIKNVDAAPENSEAYNLAGQKVSKNFKGIMIQNGKKVVIK